MPDLADAIVSILGGREITRRPSKVKTQNASVRRGTSWIHFAETRAEDGKAGWIYDKSIEEISCETDQSTYTINREQLLQFLISQVKDLKIYSGITTPYTRISKQGSERVFVCFNIEDILLRCTKVLVSKK